jgi:hypothetical protein
MVLYKVKDSWKMLHASRIFFKKARKRIGGIKKPVSEFQLTGLQQYERREVSIIR